VDMVEILSKIWPMLVAFVMLVIVLAKADNRLAVLEEKVKTLFDNYRKAVWDGVFCLRQDDGGRRGLRSP